MKNKEIVDSILDSIRSELNEFVEQQSEISSSLEYEERVLALSRKFANDVILKSQGKLPKSRNSKKSLDECGTNGT